jgi:hypothetical protein
MTLSLSGLKIAIKSEMVRDRGTVSTDHHNRRSGLRIKLFSPLRGCFSSDLHQKGYSKAANIYRETCQFKLSVKDD